MTGFGRRLRRYRAAVGVVAIGTCLAYFGPPALAAQPASTTVSESAPAIDLSNPGGTINDPTAALTPVDTECHDSQIDLNQATQDELARGLSISGPTAMRIIALRPWLKGSDLSSVPGVGPNRSAELGAKTCATQPALPIPTPMACAPGQVDLQSASAADISSLLKLSRSTANGIVSARPLPQDLHQVIAPRVNGLSGPKLDRLLAAQSICVTPPPMFAAGSGWRWATPTGGAAVRRGDFALFVPPGRVLDPSGAYISVTPLSPDENGMPQMDGTIHGAWNQGQTTVAVQGPWQGDGSSRPAIIHEKADGDTSLSVGNAAVVDSYNGRPVVNGLLTSLSISAFGSSDCAKPLNPGQLPSALCISDLTDGSIKNIWLQQTNQAGARAGSKLATASSWTCPRVDLGDSTATTNGRPAPGIACDTAAAGSPYAWDTARWVFQNRAYADLWDGVASAGVVYSYVLGPNSTSHRVSDGEENNGLLARLIQHAQPGTIYPSQSLSIIKQSSFLGTNVYVYPDMLATIDWAGAELLVGQLFDMAGAQWDLVYQLLQTTDACDDGLTLGCVKTLIEGGLAAAGTQAERGSSLANKLDTIGRVFKVFDTAQATASISAATYANAEQAIDNSGTTKLYNIPNEPTVDSKGRPIVGQCLSRDDYRWTIDEGCQDIAYQTGSEPVPGSGGSDGFPNGKIVRDPQGHAYFLNYDAGTLGGIATGGEYLCLAKHYIVDWNADMAVYRSYPTGQNPACDGSLPDTRPITVDNLQGPVLLRDTNGHWYQWGAGVQGQLDDKIGQSDVDCLVAPYPWNWNVWDQVPTSVIAGFTTRDGVTQYCGSSQF